METQRKQPVREAVGKRASDSSNHCRNFAVQPRRPTPDRELCLQDFVEVLFRLRGPCQLEMFEILHRVVRHILSLLQHEQLGEHAKDAAELSGRLE